MSIMLQKSVISAFSFGPDPGGKTQRIGGGGGGGGAASMRPTGIETGRVVPRKATCCVPGRPCPFYGEPIRPGDEAVVRVECSNEACRESGWVHGDCFEAWERTLVAQLRSCGGRASQWTDDRQRSQNLWTKQAYDLVRPACACRCGSGFVRKDLSYVPGVVDRAAGEDRRLVMKHRRRSEPASKKCHQLFFHHLSTKEEEEEEAATRPWFDPFRSRTVSMSSGGSSPPHSGSDASSQSSQESDEAAAAAVTTLLSKTGIFPGGHTPTPAPAPAAATAATGNIFKHRSDFNAFRDLPVALRNPYHVKLEDEGQFGNDETRSFILVTLSVQNVTAVDCVLCGDSMPVFDKYPLVDGTFFLSPRRYNTDLRVRFHGAQKQQQQYVNAVCFRCMIGARRTLRCRFCRSEWQGSTLVIGSMYAYDVFAAMSCCAAHQTCSGCRRRIVVGGPKMQFFSDFSRRFACPHCAKEDCHFVKPIEEFYLVI